MKLLFITTALALPLCLLATPVFTIPIAHDPQTSVVVLKLSNDHAARCIIPNSPSRAKADIVSSKLVASGKMACKKTHEHFRGGKTMTCDLGQQATEDEGKQTLKDACESSQGIHAEV